MSRLPRIARVAVPAPLPGCFDYLLPADSQAARGTRVRVPFGRRRLTGVVVGDAPTAAVETGRLRAVEEVVDDAPLLDEEMMGLLEWAADYYHHPLGEVVAAALPVALRQGKPAQAGGGDLGLRLTGEGAMCGPEEFSRAPRRAALHRLLAAHPQGIDRDDLDRLAPGWRPAAKALAERGIVEFVAVAAGPSAVGRADALELNEAQRCAVETIGGSQGFAPFLLHGVTGSGKTEVYLRLAAEVVARGEQLLILVPEIGLTPQIVERFRARIASPLALLHSGLAEGERRDAWLAARSGAAGIVIGTRSAVFTPLARPGLIIVDEEHDTSFKQQDGFRYSARDLAVVRARRAGIPVLLGSATPSLEALANCERGAWSRISLPERAGSGRHPTLRLIDTRIHRTEEGLTTPVVDAIRRTVEGGGQALIFINRRGFAPVLCCDGCGWTATCSRCDARMTLHGGGRGLRCHHCGSTRPAPPLCPECGNEEGLRPAGQGTERVEAALAGLFPDAGVARIDRDSTRRKGSMERLLAEVGEGRHRILVGTQMLAKGHHFPEIALVAILNADQGLFSPDFRAAERMAQLVTQVAGRAGRADRPGEVVIQTRHPDHPLLTTLLAHGFEGFAAAALEDRRATRLPPFAGLALLRAESTDPRAPLDFLDTARRLFEGSPRRGVELLGPAPAPMERRAGRVRAQLLLRALSRADLQNALREWVPLVYGIKEARRVRWSIDVDPQEMD